MLKSMFAGLVILVLVVFCAACNTPSWVTTAEQEVPVIVSGVNAVLAAYVTLDSNPADVTKAKTVGAQVTGDLTLVSSLVQGFQADQNSATLTQINTAITQASNDLPAILTAIHVSDPTSQAKAAAIVDILQSELQSISASLPATASPVAMIGSSPAPLPPRVPNPAKKPTFEPAAFLFGKTAAKTATKTAKSKKRKLLGAKKLRQRLNKVLNQSDGSKNDGRFQKAVIKK